MKNSFNSIAQLFLLFSIICLAAFHANSTPIVISGSTDNDIIGRSCRMPNGNLITIVERNPDWGSGDLYVTFSSDDGNTWSSLTPIVTDAGNQSTFSLVLSSDDILHLFYASNESGFYKIYSLKSEDGIIWNNKQQIDLGWTATQQVYGPIVICEQDNSFTMVYIAMGGGAYIANCPYNGTWDVNKTMVQSGAYRARVCKKEETYLVAYHRNISGNYDIHVKSSTDRTNWSSEIDITSNGNSHDAYCNVTEDGRYILYYAKHYPAHYNLCKRESEDGIIWSDEESITSDAVNNTQPSFFIEGTTLYLTWTHAVDYDTDNDIYFEKFDLGSSGNDVIRRIKANIFYDKSSRNIVIEKPNMCGKITVIISDILGKEYFVHSYFDKKNVLILNSAYIREGIYIVNLYTEKMKYSKKILVSY